MTVSALCAEFQDVLRSYHVRRSRLPADIQQVTEHDALSAITVFHNHRSTRIFVHGSLRAYNMVCLRVLSSKADRRASLILAHDNSL